MGKAYLAAGGCLFGGGEESAGGRCGLLVGDESEGGEGAKEVFTCNFSRFFVRYLIFWGVRASTKVACAFGLRR